MILITGGAGVMGSVLVRRLCALGERVRALTLPGDPFVSRLAGCDVDVRYGDIARAESLSGICDGVTTVYHLAAVILASGRAVYEMVNVQGTKNVVAEARRAGVKQFVQVSSASVVYPKTTTYSLSKRAGEEVVRQSGIDYAIIRPTLVYDKGSGGEEIDRFLDYLRRFPVVPFVGPGRALKRPVFVGDLIDGLAAVCGNPKAGGKTYNLSGGEAISIFDFARLCLGLMGQGRKPIVRLPTGMCVALSKVMSMTMRHPPLTWQMIAGMVQDADLDPSEASRDLGYCPAKVSEKLPECFPRQH